MFINLTKISLQVYKTNQWKCLHIGLTFIFRKWQQIRQFFFVYLNDAATFFL